MKKTIIGILLASLSFGVGAVEMAKIDLSQVSTDTCAIASKVIKENGELVKPLSEDSVVAITDKVTDYNYRVMADYFDESARLLDEQGLETFGKEGIDHFLNFKEDLLDKSMYGIQYFLENRTCTGL